MITAAVMTLVCVAGGVAMALKGGNGGFPLVVTAVTFAALLFPYMSFLFADFEARARAVFGGHPRRLFAFAAGAVALQLLYALGTDTIDLWATGRLALFVFLPSLIAVAAARWKTPSWLDLLAVACVWLPFDTRHLNGIWNWPQGDGAYILNTALALSLAAAVFVGFRGLQDVKIRLLWSKTDIVRAVVSLLAFMVVAIPFGFATDFIKLNPNLELGKVLATPVGLFFFVAIPEELLFRGLVQNILQKKLKSVPLALILASVFFGATHYNNTPSPDWRYLLLATLAGALYGWNYLKGKSLLGAALLHTLVDSVWYLFFLNEALKLQ